MKNESVVTKMNVSFTEEVLYFKESVIFQSMYIILWNILYYLTEKFIYLKEY